MREHDGENAANNNTGEGLLCKATAPEEESFPIKKNQPNKQHPPPKKIIPGTCQAYSHLTGHLLTSGV